jgi:peptide deformylase
VTAHPADPAPDLRSQVELLLSGPRPLPIVQAGHPVLRRVAARYAGELEGELLAELISAMQATMRSAPGVGLAAPQIGLGVALAVIEDLGGLDGEVADARERSAVPFRVIVNPRYEPVTEERVSFYEGCLSVRGWHAVTPRWRTVRLTCQDESGADRDEVVTGWPARIVQHETDHLAGRLYLDGAQLRSLADDANAARWAGEPVPERAARELGFDLPETERGPAIPG